MNKKYRSLIEAAKKAQKNAYCPHSHYPVGAAVLGKSGRVYAGVNVESPTLIAHTCAERNAIFNAITHGERQILAVASVSRNSDSCGACRQMILEFAAGDIPVFGVHQKPPRGKPHVVETTISKLMPCPHTGKNFGFNPNKCEADHAK